MWFYFRLFIKPTDIPPVFGGMDRPHPRTKTLRGKPDPLLRGEGMRKAKNS
jgi:hypothetical protein